MGNAFICPPSTKKVEKKKTFRCLQVNNLFERYALFSCVYPLKNWILLFKVERNFHSKVLAMCVDSTALEVQSRI